MEKNGGNATSERSKHPMDLLLKQKHDASHLPKPGDILEGGVIEKKGSRLYIDLGSRGTGIVYGREYYEASDIVKRLIPGDRVTPEGGGGGKTPGDI